MLTMHPTLLIGPSDWQPDAMPRSEFVDRTEALWQHDPRAERAIVYGNSAHHAELAYFTNFVPKLDAAVAILSRAGGRRLLVGGGVNMLGAARPLTFIEDLLPLQEIGNAVRADPSGGRTLIIGAGYMTTGLRRAVTAAIGTSALAPDATAQVWAQMSRKSGREIDAIRRAGTVASIGQSVMLEAFEAGAKVSAIVAAGEQAAYAEGAQDVRTLFSLDGGRTFRPFLAPIDQSIDTLHVYLAARRFNYWADGFSLLSREGELDSLLEKVIAARPAAYRFIRAGTPAADIAAMIEGAISPCKPHPITARAFAQRMGLALHEPPYSDLGPTFEDREVYSLRFGITDDKTRHHIASTMIRVLPGGHNLL
jgi:hypothetical protein